MSKALITGGAGFVGCNYAWNLLNKGCQVVVYDNFARGIGCQRNVEWLKSNQNAPNLRIVRGDIEDFDSLHAAASDCRLIVHTAAQVSVPLSIDNPLLDFRSNAIGTFNVLEIARRLSSNPVVIYTSSNKVYGIPDVELAEMKTRYDFRDYTQGISEDFPLRAEEPYGVSKTVGDQYARAYFLQHGLKVTSFRCSCMYGPRQWGKEEQGWLGWFCIAALAGNTITFFGDGKQVRDVLYIDDVVRAFDSAIDNIDKASGEAMNLGGGKENTLSLLETIAFLEEVSGRKVQVRYSNWRPRDSKCYYTDNSKALRLLGWKPEVHWKEGIARTYKWVADNVRQAS